MRKNGVRTKMKSGNLQKLIAYLRAEYEHKAPDFGPADTFDTFRGLVNVRPPLPIGDDFLAMQDELLREIARKKGIVSLADLTPVRDNLYVWQGDITTLAVDAIVNAANAQMTGCCIPAHKCIDNAIHTFAGVQLRMECDSIIKAQGHLEPTGSAKITKGYNLPAKYVLHTVGPIVSGTLKERDCEMLVSCYRACLELAAANGAESIAFCCISTGEFHFPNEKAAEIAVQTVTEYLKNSNSKTKVIFNVFKDLDRDIYRELLG